jgi:hypothetical protein
MAWLLGMFLLLAAGDYGQNTQSVPDTSNDDAQAYVADGGGGLPPK